jgi:hypothetical protein
MGVWRRKEGRRIETHDVGMIETLEHGHLVPYDLPFSLDFFFDVAFTVTSCLTSPDGV